MEFYGTLGIFIPVIAIGVIVFFVIALVQEGKAMGRGEAVKNAFVHIVSLVMLSFLVASSIYLLQLGFKSWVFTKAQDPFRPAASPPPMLYLSGDKAAGGPVLYSCDEKCEFNTADREQFKTWKEQYATWKNEGKGAQSASLQKKRNVVNALSFLIVSLPLYWWFFIRMVQGDARKNRAAGQKPGPLRSVYFYLVAFAGLIGAVVSAALLVNTALNVALKIDTDKSTASREPAAVSPVGVSTENYGVKSVVNCAEKCQLTDEDRQLAQEWLVDFDAWQKQNIITYPTPSNTQSSLASNIPLLLVLLPLFLYHFLTIRRETAVPESSSPAPPTT
ncbi:MAG: hypothetical protein HY567_03085 [Candidatus Kerfeldbacteria bacterium]|nr:hypothetical protein [Candidatus Kerfeldbacteria bacterium]